MSGRRCARAERRARRVHRSTGAGSARRRVHPVGDRDSHRRSHPRHQSLRRAERSAGQGCNQRAARSIQIGWSAARAAAGPDSGPRCGADADERRQAGPCSPRGRRVPDFDPPARLRWAPCVSGTGPCALRGPPPVPDVGSRSNARGHDVRVRASLPSLDGAASQRRAEHRRLHFITAVPRVDVPIPSQPFSFGTLELPRRLEISRRSTQAGRRAVHVNLPSPDAGLLDAALDALLAPFGRAQR